MQCPPTPSSEHPGFISNQVAEGDYFFLELSPAPHEAISVVCGGREQSTAAYEVNRESFPYYAIEYIAQGRAQVDLDGRTHWMETGSVFSYGPTTRHRIGVIGSKPLTKYFVDFTGCEASQLLRQTPLKDGQPRQLAQTRWLRSNFDQMIECGASTRTNATLQCVLLLRLLVSRLSGDASLVPVKPSDAYDTYLRCRRHIENHYLSLGTTNEVASKCGIDPAYLSRIFHRFSDVRPYQLLMRLKMDHAVRLLVHHKFSVQQTGRAIGYQDAYHFSRSFKRVYGLSPQHFKDTMEYRYTNDRHDS